MLARLRRVAPIFCAAQCRPLPGCETVQALMVAAGRDPFSRISTPPQVQGVF